MEFGKTNVSVKANEGELDPACTLTTTTSIRWKLLRNLCIFILLTVYAVWLQTPTDASLDEMDNVVVLLDLCGYDPVAGTPRDSMFPIYHPDSATVVRGTAERTRFRERFSFLWTETLGVPSSLLCAILSNFS